MHMLQIDLCILGLIRELKHSNLNMWHSRLTSKGSLFFGIPCTRILSSMELVLLIFFSINCDKLPLLIQFIVPVWHRMSMEMKN